jgi:HlyD family secretion protein
MDIPRKSQARKRLIRRALITVVLIGAIAGISWYLQRLQPAAPGVDRATVWIDTVKRGEMIRQVRGIGTLVPLEIRWLPALTDGRVEQKPVLPGAHVSADTVLLVLSNPQLELEKLNAEWDWKAAESALMDLKVKLDNQQLAQEAEAARIRSDHSQATLRAEADENLAKLGLIPDLTLKLDKVTAQELGNRLEIEKRRLEANKDSIKAQLEVQRVKVEQLKAVYELKKIQFDQLRVRAGVSGVLQLLPVEVGQRVTPGTNLARVADPTRLKAELKIPETQAKDVQIGQSASVDTRNGIIAARVIRVDPSVISGTRTVDVALLGDLPKGAVPDLSVDGTIELERLTDVINVGRPVQGQAESLITLFKLEPETGEAIRVQVKLGRSSVNAIEVREGLKPGDQVILSDMSAQDSFNRIRLK